jgi:hypothetical protein
VSTRGGAFLVGSMRSSIMPRGRRDIPWRDVPRLLRDRRPPTLHDDRVALVEVGPEPYLIGKTECRAPKEGL